MTARPPAASQPLALTMGDPAGIGGEIALRAWQKLSQGSATPFFLIDSPERLTALAEELDWLVPIRSIADPSEAGRCFDQALPVLKDARQVYAFGEGK